MALETILVCDDFNQTNQKCNQFREIEGYILEPAEAAFYNNGGVDFEVVYWASGQTIIFFVIGVCIGSLINILRKARK